MPLPAELGLEEHACMLEMRVERVRGSLRVVGIARCEQPLVELAVQVLRLAGGGEQRWAEALRPVPDGADQRHEPRRLRGLVEREVKLGMGAHGLADVARAAHLVEALEVPAGRDAVRPR